MKGGASEFDKRCLLRFDMLGISLAANGNQAPSIVDLEPAEVDRCGQVSTRGIHR
jgi:hypothetical protein